MKNFSKSAPINESNVNTYLNLYGQKYGQHLSVYESHSARRRINESVSPYELIALAQQLDQWHSYRQFCENANKLGSLGAIPQIALDVITASQSASILPLLASTQPMTEESGIVYYRNVRAMQNGGGYQKNDVIISPLSLDNPGDGTFGTNRKRVTAAQTQAGTQVYTGNFGPVPLRPYRVEFHIQLSTGALWGKDNGAGKIMGFGFDGEVDYETGVWTIEFKKDPAETADLQALYDVDVDAQKELDSIQGQLDSKPIKAQIWALKSDIGAFANYAFNQRFGSSASEEVANDLTDELTRVMNAAAVLEIARNVPTVTGGYTQWDVTPPPGVSYAEHKMTFIDAIAAAEAVLHKQSGSLMANRMIAGTKAAAALRGMADFVLDPNASQGVSIGVFGTYNGVPVIRASNIIHDDELILVNNSGNYFNAPLAYAPFMPLMITDTVQSVDNPFRSTQAAGIWAGLTSVNPSNATKIIINRK